MSALAQYLRWQGLEVSGSDRLLTSEDTALVRLGLHKIGSSLFPQDGTGIRESTDAVCVSTAIENSNPDIAAARSRNIPVVHRSDILASIVQSKKTIAVAGTSGKSTVTAMIFEFLTSCGLSPSVISGAAILRLEKEHLIGNAFCGSSDLLIIEADESDGTLVKYSPYLSVFLNVSKDHKTIQDVLSLFGKLADNSEINITNADDPLLNDIVSHRRFGIEQAATWKPQWYRLTPRASTFSRYGFTYHLPLPGLHNLSNCAAALSVCELLGCSPESLVKAVESYQGVSRRFTIINTNDDVIVVDDFAHNPEKIKAALCAARGLAERIHVIYQPHGFGPTRFLKNEYIEVFRSQLTSADSLFLLPIYYAGGTAQQDISSADIIDGLGEVPYAASVPESRTELLEQLKKKVSPGDCVLLMGARDPSLSPFALKITDLFGGVSA